MQDHISMSCQVCPRGCFLEAEKGPGEDWVISGNDCERGYVFFRARLAYLQDDEDETDKTSTEHEKEDSSCQF